MVWIQVQILLLVSCVTLKQLFPFSVSLFLHPKMRSDADKPILHRPGTLHKGLASTLQKSQGHERKPKKTRLRHHSRLREPKRHSNWTQCEVMGGMLGQDNASQGQIIIGYMNITTPSSPWREFWGVCLKGLLKIPCRSRLQPLILIAWLLTFPSLAASFQPLFAHSLPRVQSTLQ